MTMHYKTVVVKAGSLYHFSNQSIIIGRKEERRPKQLKIASYVAKIHSHTLFNNFGVTTFFIFKQMTKKLKQTVLESQLSVFRLSIFLVFLLLVTLIINGMIKN